MKNLNVALVRLLQFVVSVLFTFMVMVYFGVMILLPLDIVVLITKFLHLFGFNTLFGAMVAVPFVAYLGRIVYTTPGLIPMIIENGIDLVNTGKQRFDAFNKLAHQSGK